MSFLLFVTPSLEPATWVLLATYLIVAVAAFAHGFIGLGFPMITTPCLALLTDLRTAVIVSVLPNIAVNIVSIARGGRWADSIGQHWRLAIYVLLGKPARHAAAGRFANRSAQAQAGGDDRHIAE